MIATYIEQLFQKVIKVAQTKFDKLLMRWGSSNKSLNIDQLIHQLVPMYNQYDFHRFKLDLTYHY